MDQGIPKPQQTWSHLTDDQILSMANSTSPAQDLANSTYDKNESASELSDSKKMTEDQLRQYRIGMFQANILDKQGHAVVNQEMAAKLHEQTKDMPDQMAIRWGMLGVAQNRAATDAGRLQGQNAKDAFNASTALIKEQKAILDTQKALILLSNGIQAPQPGSKDYAQWSHLSQQYGDLTQKAQDAMTTYQSNAGAQASPKAGAGDSPQSAVKSFGQTFMQDNPSASRVEQLGPGSISASLHPTGRALDLHAANDNPNDPNTRSQLQSYVAYAQSKQVPYIIYNRQQYKLQGDGSYSVSHYGGPDPHVDHVHIDWKGGAPGGSSLSKSYKPTMPTDSAVGDAMRASGASEDQIAAATKGKAPSPNNPVVSQNQFPQGQGPGLKNQNPPGKQAQPGQRFKTGDGVAFTAAPSKGKGK
jgi:hypothetical protein